MWRSRRDDSADDAKSSSSSSPDAGTRGYSGSTVEEMREFYQRRLALLARLAFLFLLAFYIVSNSLMLFAGERAWIGLLTALGNQLLFTNLAITGASWILLRRRPYSWSTLRAVDAGLLVSICVVFSVFAWAYRDLPHQLVTILMPVTYATLLRSVIVPSRAVRTAVVSTLGFLPFAIAATISLTDSSIHWPSELDPVSLPLVLTRCALGVGLASVISAVIYGLERQVRKARQLGQYRLDEKIGEGGMGQVFRASHAMLRRPTAIKLLRSDLANDESLARFEREVQLTSQLTHPNTVAIFDYGRTPDGTFYYAMEFLDGVDLETLVQEHGAQPPARVIHILRQVASSLAEAHASGLIHRDIKPANIIICERGRRPDVAKVVDFGLVKNLGAEATPTHSSALAITGTPRYMSPESIRSPDQVDSRSDLYSVGAVGYYLLTAANLFDTDNVMEICSHHLNTTPSRPSERLGRAVPADLESVIMGCLEKEPGKRPAEARLLIEHLDACEDARGWTDEDARAWWTEHVGEPTPAAAAAHRLAKASESSGEEAWTADVDPSGVTVDAESSSRPRPATGSADSPTVSIDLNSRFVDEKTQ